MRVPPRHRPRRIQSSCIRPRDATFRCKAAMLHRCECDLAKRARKIIVEEVEDVREALHIMRSMKDSVVSSGDVEVKWRKEAPMLMDLGGMTEIFIQLRTDLVLQLSRELGVRPIVGLLLHGLPGSGSGPGYGKTRFAQAIAYESGFKFYPLSATELVSGVSGVAFEEGNIIIRELFAMAKRTAPSVVFIDDIDAIASKRECLETRFVTMARQLTICIDEAHDDYLEASDEDSPGDYVLVIGATNRLDAIEPALRRPGRFDREILVTIPHESDLRSKPADDDEDWKREPWLPKEIDEFAIEMPDFEEAPEMAQPSLIREDLSPIPNVKWEDVGGLDLLKQEFDLHILRRIQCCEAGGHDEGLGMNLETRFLLYGPPGCGKTLIAKAVANEAGANFIHIKGPELLDKYGGESEPTVLDIFSRARKCAPCILFFDEVDALTTKRGKEGGLLNQLLIELDGAEQCKCVFVIGATNRPEVMDLSVLQPGRFGNLLYVPLPSPDDRVSILKALAKDMPVDASVDLSAIGRLKACENFSGADLAALMNEASMVALKETLTLFETTSAALTTIKTAHFKVALRKVSPSVSDMQRQYYQRFSESLKAA